MEAKRIPQERLADAYLLLGEAELEISRYAWASPALQYLELAIHSAADRSLARRAFDLYEQEIVAGYSGSSGTHIPHDVREHMEGVRGVAYPPAAPEAH